MTQSNFDSLIFDMDGTLWDAVDSYCAVWNRTIVDLGTDRATVCYSELAVLMGKPLDEIFMTLIGDVSIKDEFICRLLHNERTMMPELGGSLYPGTKETIEALSRFFRLFMVSNCGVDGLPNFLRFTGLEPYFTDTLSFGQNGKEKDANIREIVKRYNLKAPLYIGDVARDCSDAHRAGVPFAWAAYGFGKNVNDADYVLTSIEDLPSICLKRN